MRALRAAHELPELAEPLAGVCGYSFEEAKDMQYRSYGMQVDERANTASIEIAGGVPQAPELNPNDFGLIERTYGLFTGRMYAGDADVLKRSEMDEGVGAITRLSEQDLSAYPRNRLRTFGSGVLLFTRMTALNSTYLGKLQNLGGAYNIVDRQDPTDHVMEHSDEYTALLPFLSGKTKKIIQEYLAGSRSTSIPS